MITLKKRLKIIQQALVGDGQYACANTCAEAIERINELESALTLYQRERDRYANSRPEITGNYFLSGGHGDRDSNQLPEYVTICPAYGCGWDQVYQKTSRTISYEGS